MNITTGNYDIIFWGIFICSTLLALMRGGIAEILSISSWFVAIWVMKNFGPLIGSIIPDSIHNYFLRGAIIFLIAFVSVAVFIVIIKKICAKFLDSVDLGGLNYIIAALFGIMRGAVVCALLVITIEMLHLDKMHAWRQAKLYPVLTPVISWIVDAIPKSIKEFT